MLVKGNNSWSIRSGRGPRKWLDPHFFLFEYAKIVMKIFKYLEENDDSKWDILPIKASFPIPSSIIRLSS